MTQDITEAATFLLVDDDAISIMAMKRALKKLKIVNETLVAKDGQEALDILRAAAEVAGNRLPPFIVTLDLNMPRMNGLEFLEAVRADPRLHRLVVFVFTTSDMPGDIRSAYSKNVAGYLVKDNPGETFAKALEMLGSYSRIVELPA
ncbi:response regulator [Roseobacter sinensis]|uniref:Response regulator n=1 Tax=Roseobacter sinensis TaxID=2931391 RepID=A0ABT3BAJ8_9RHOB|nr:response regulator [Roseobacter sp. WL0113]MCV3270601.1 response regulator [Roseobacter sp. WL0113]